MFFKNTSFYPTIVCKAFFVIILPCILDMFIHISYFSSKPKQTKEVSRIFFICLLKNQNKPLNYKDGLTRYLYSTVLFDATLYNSRTKLKIRIFWIKNATRNQIDLI